MRVCDRERPSTGRRQRRGVPRDRRHAAGDSAPRRGGDGNVVDPGAAPATMVRHVVGSRAHDRGRRHPRRRGCRLHRARRRPGQANGRNGAGKTSLLKVLGGMAGPKSGVIQRPPARLPALRPPAGHCRRPRHHAPQPRAGRPGPGRAGRPPGGAAPQDGGPARRRAAGGPLSRAHDAFEHAGGYAAESEVRSLLSAGPALRPGRRCHHRPVGRRAPPGRVGPHPVLGQRPAAAGRADQPPGQRRPRVAAWVPAVLPGRADRHQPRPGAAGRVDRVLHLDRPGEADVGEITEQ